MIAYNTYVVQSEFVTMLNKGYCMNIDRFKHFAAEVCIVLPLKIEAGCFDFDLPVLTNIGQ